MNYILVPLSFKRSDGSVTIEREVEERLSMMDNLVELVVFTPIGSFRADPDFGLEYWNYEYANISDTQFNTGADRGTDNKQSLKEQCEASIAESIKTYAPEKLNVKDIMVTMNLNDDAASVHGTHNVYSHHIVVIHVAAKIDNGMDTSFQYTTEITFMMEPATKRMKR